MDPTPTNAEAMYDVYYLNKRKTKENRNQTHKTSWLVLVPAIVAFYDQQGLLRTFS